MVPFPVQVPRCEKWIKAACLDVFDEINCNAAISTCSSELSGPFSQTGTSPTQSLPSRDDTSCQASAPTISAAHATATLKIPCVTRLQSTYISPYLQSLLNCVRVIAAYLDQPAIRTQLGVDPSISNRNFSACSNDINAAFFNTMDEFHATQYYVASLLDRGVKALVYVGKYDWICNWVGNERWTLALEWSGKNGFVNQELRSWNIDGKKVGSVRNSGPFTFVTVDGAGHMVCSFCSLWKMRWMFNALHRFHMINLSRRWRL